MNVREELKAYVDNELSAAERQEVDRALSSSPELREELEWLQQARAELAVWKGTPPPTGKEALIAKLAARPKPVSIWKSRPLALAGMAATCLAVLALIGMLNRSGIAPATESAQSSTFAQAGKEVVGMAPKTRDGATEGMVASGAESYADAEVERAPSPQVMAKATRPSKPEMEDNSKSVIGAHDSGEAPAMSGEAATPKTIPNTGANFGGHKIIFTGNIAVQVVDTDVAVDKATSIARKFGGFTVNSNVVVNEKAPSSATLTLRVPSLHFDAAVSELKSLGKLLSANNTGEDVTAQIVDLDARIKTMKATEEQYRQILRRTTRIGDVLDVQQRLGEIRAEIESLQSQSSTYKEMSRLSTIELSITEDPKPANIEEPKPDDWATDAWNSSVNALNTFGRAVGRGLITLFVISPIWIPAALIGWFIVRKSRKVL